MQSRSIKLSRICLDGFLIASQSIKKLSVWPIDSRQHLNKFISVEIQCSTDLDRFSIHQDVISLYMLNAKSDSFSHFSLDIKYFSLPPNTLFSLKSLYPHDFRPRPRSNHLVSVLNPSFSIFHAIQTQVLGFFEVFVKILGWVLFI